MTNNVSITNLKEYAARMAKPIEIRYTVTMTPKAREWFLRDLCDRAKRVNDALNSDTIKEKTRLLRQKEAEEILAAYEAIENAEVIKEQSDV